MATGGLRDVAGTLDLMIGGHQDYSDNFHCSWHSGGRIRELLGTAGFVAVKGLPVEADGWEAWEGFPRGEWADTDFLVACRKPAHARRPLTISGWAHTGSLLRINARLTEHFAECGYEVSYHVGCSTGAENALASEPVLMEAALRPLHGDVWINHWGAFPDIPRNLALAIASCDCTLMSRAYTEEVNRRCQAVAAPSTFSARILRDSGVDVPIDLIPNGVDCSVFRPEGDRADLNADGRFVFFTHCYMQPRKGFDILLDAYLSAFSHDDPVILIAKNAGFDAQRTAETLGRLLRSRSAPPEVRLISGFVSETELGAMLRASDCFVWASRIEGFGLPPLEALACGKAVIAPSFGGHVDYLSDECAYLYPIAGMERVPRDYGEFPFHDPRGEWSRPDVGALRECLRHAFENPEEVRIKGQAGRQVALQHDWRGILQLYEDWVRFRLEHGATGAFRGWEHLQARGLDALGPLSGREPVGVEVTHQ